LAFYTYILSNPLNTVLYTGVTNDLRRRIYEHREKLVDGFAERYNATKLVYYEVHHDPEQAILREKKLKNSPRKRKLKMVFGINPGWRDLYEDICRWLSANSTEWDPFGRKMRLSTRSLRMTVRYDKNRHGSFSGSFM